MTQTSATPQWVDHVLDLAAQEATGRFVVASEPSDTDGWILLRDGEIAGASGDVRRPLLGRRLVAFGLLSEQQVTQHLSVLRQQQGRRLLDLLIHEHAVPESFFTSYLRNTLAEQVGSMTAFAEPVTHFEPGPVPHAPLRLPVHEVLTAAFGMSHSFPEQIADLAVRGVGAPPPELPVLHGAVMRSADGSRRPGEIADDCGLTVAETVQVLTDLHGRRLVQLVRPAVPPAAPAAAPPASAPIPPAAAATPPPLGPPPPAPPAPRTGPVPVIRPLAPEPVERESEGAPRSTPEGRREALTALAALTEPSEATPSPAPPPPPEPQAEVTTTSPRIWTKRPTRPANPMESGDVLRELKSLGD